MIDIEFREDAAVGLGIDKIFRQIAGWLPGTD
jgi:hypothetical protein